MHLGVEGLSGYDKAREQWQACDRIESEREGSILNCIYHHEASQALDHGHSSSIIASRSSATFHYNLTFPSVRIMFLLSLVSRYLIDIALLIASHPQLHPAHTCADPGVYTSPSQDHDETDNHSRQVDQTPEAGMTVGRDEDVAGGKG